MTNRKKSFEFEICPLQQSRMEERLDDAIHVLRSHAEGQMPGLPPHPGAPHHLPGMPPMLHSQHSTTMLDTMASYQSMAMAGHHDSHMVSTRQFLPRKKISESWHRIFLFFSIASHDL